jgi:hypothetical protein
MPSAGRPVLLVAAIIMAMAVGNTAAAASTWTVPLASASHGQGQAYALPPAPTASAACSGVVLGSIIVTWTAVSPPGTTYTIYRSTNSGSFNSIATGVTGTTYTASGLGLASYAFKVQGVAGANWVGAISAATATHSITLILCT